MGFTNKEFFQVKVDHFTEELKDTGWMTPPVQAYYRELLQVATKALNLYDREEPPVGTVLIVKYSADAAPFTAVHTGKKRLPWMLVYADGQVSSNSWAGWYPHATDGFSGSIEVVE